MMPIKFQLEKRCFPLKKFLNQSTCCFLLLETKAIYVYCILQYFFT